MKKAIALFMVISLVFVLFTACSNPPEAAGGAGSAPQESAAAAGDSAAAPQAPAESAAAPSGDTAAPAGGADAAVATSAQGTLQSMVNPEDEYVLCCAFDNIEFFNAHRYGWQRAGELLGVKTTWEGIAGSDVPEFVSLIDNVIARNPKGIVVFGLDAGITPSIEKAVQAGIPIMTWESDIETSPRDTWIGSAPYNLGYTGGKKFAEALGGSGDVAILSQPGFEMYDGRKQGYEDAFAEFPGINVVAVGNTETDNAVAVQAAKDILVANPNLAGFVCCDATGPMGAVTAIEEAGLTGKVKVLGLDRDTALLQQIKDGTVDGSVVQDDITMLYWALVDLVSANYYGNALLTTDNKAAGAKLTPNKIECAMNYIDSSNVDFYMAANDIYLQALDSKADANAPTLQSQIDPNDQYEVVCCIDSIEYWNAHRYAWKEAGKLYGVKTNWNGMTGDDVTEMVTLFDSVAAKNPAGIVVLGWDDGLAPSIDSAVAAGIPVVCFSGDVPASARNTWVGSDNHDIGYVGGKAYAESINGQGKVAILTYPGKGLFDERQKGFEDAFSEYPGIEVVAVGNTETDEAISVQAAKDILTAYPDLNGFVCCDATGPNGAATAIEEAGLTGKVDVLGLDRDTAMLQRIKDGSVTGSVVQDDATMLFWAMTSLITAKYYDPVALMTTDNAASGVRLSPDKIKCAINYINKDNVDYYIEANKLYLEGA